MSHTFISGSEDVFHWLNRPIINAYIKPGKSQLNLQEWKSYINSFIQFIVILQNTSSGNICHTESITNTLLSLFVAMDGGPV